MDPLPPPFLSTAPLGPPPAPASNGAGPASEDPILSAYDRPEGVPVAAEGGLPIGPDEVTAFLVGVADVLAAWRGEHWKVEPGELAMVSPALARQLAGGDSALAQWIVEHGDALIIGVSAALIVVPRAAVEYQWIRYRRELARREREAAQTGVPTYDLPSRFDTAPEVDLGARPGVRDDGDQGGAEPRPTDPRALASALATLGG